MDKIDASGRDVGKPYVPGPWLSFANGAVPGRLFVNCGQPVHSTPERKTKLLNHRKPLLTKIFKKQFLKPRVFLLRTTL